MEPQNKYDQEERELKWLPSTPIGVFGFKPANQSTNVVNRTLPEKRSIGLRLGFMGYRFGTGFLGYRFGIGFLGYGFGIGFLGYGFGIGFYGI